MRKLDLTSLILVSSLVLTGCKSTSRTPATPLTPEGPAAELAAAESGDRALTPTTLTPGGTTPTESTPSTDGTSPDTEENTRSGGPRGTRPTTPTTPPATVPPPASSTTAACTTAGTKGTARRLIVENGLQAKTRGLRVRFEELTLRHRTTRCLKTVFNGALELTIDRSGIDTSLDQPILDGYDDVASSTAGWVYVYVLANEQGDVHGLLSRDRFRPKFPAGYDYVAFVSAAYFDGETFRRFHQLGQRIYYEKLQTAFNGVPNADVELAKLVPPMELVVTLSGECDARTAGAQWLAVTEVGTLPNGGASPGTPPLRFFCTNASQLTYDRNTTDLFLDGSSMIYVRAVAGLVSLTLVEVHGFRFDDN